ncbi:MAG: hypothetical protein BWY65_02263 [Firmicutes bacterium ADurb.Bin373]|nr:MAG: hypothetical protein BWY65_02263 [Firmicutes bacterium ADurb.Bin373]
MLMSMGVIVLGFIEISIFPVMQPNQVGCLYQVIAQVLVAGADTFNIFGFPLAGLLFVPHQAGELGQCLVVFKTLDIADFRQNAGGIYRADTF